MADDFRLQEECQHLQDTSSYTIENEHDVRSMDNNEVTALLEGSCHPFLVRPLEGLTVWIDAVEQVAESSENITSPFIFDVYRSLLKCVAIALC